MTFEVKNGYFGYKTEGKILQDINFTVRPGTVTAILGPNGAGKTTLLRCMMGLLSWQKGGSFIDGENITHIPSRELWKKIAYVPQAKGQVPMYTAEEMVVLGRSAHIGMTRQPSKKDIELGMRAMEDIGVSHLKNKICSQMSGGELQMILIARALATQPDMLVLDEPESNLDFKNQLIVLNTMQKLSKNHGISCVFNTHYPDHALKISDKSLLMEKRGKVIFGDSKDVITCPHMKDSFEVEIHIKRFKLNNVEISTVLPVSVIDSA